MENIELLQLTWFFLILFLLVGYSLLDGFDLGVGMVLPFLGKEKEEKVLLFNSLAPVWDGNEVWLITAGGALFAAFPQAYATVFSGFYAALTCALGALILRAVSIEFRHHDRKLERCWERMFVLGSFLATIILGLALGNVIYGIPLNGRMEYAGSFITLFRPVPLLIALTLVFGFAVHGVAWVIAKTGGELQKRAMYFGRYLIFPYLIAAVLLLYFLFTYFNHLRGHVGFYLALVLFLIGEGGFIWTIKKNRDRGPLIFSSLTLIGLWMALAWAQLPCLVRASNDPVLSITIFNGSTGIYTLQVMTVLAIIGMPLVIAYSYFVYRCFRGKVDKGKTY